MDHDQRFKVLLQEFFAEFMRLFFPQWADRFDFARIEWLMQEVFVNPPQGERGSVDLVAKVAVRHPMGTPSGQSWIVLVHIEIESADKVAPLRRRVFEYYEHLRAEHDLPVLPVGVYLRVGLDGVGWDVYEEYFWEHRLLHFEYAYVGLPALDAEQYVRGENILGVALAALMRVPEERRAWLKEQAFQRFAMSQENDARRYLLFECVDAYMPLQGPQLGEFEAWLSRDANAEVKTMAYTSLGQARQEGRVEGQRKMARLLLESRFGPLSPLALQRLESMSEEQLRELAIAFPTAQSLQELGLAG
jgi:hypothetical protein